MGIQKITSPYIAVYQHNAVTGQKTLQCGNESAPLELNAISETDMPLLNDGDILTLPEIKEAKTVKIFTATGEEIKYFVYAPQMSIASLPGGFYTVYILNNAGAQTFVGTIVK